jgi:type VI secretion system protein ImpF
MGKNFKNQPLLPSLLDRLMDQESQGARDSGRSRGQGMRELKESVRCDVENLLNTRWCCSTWPPNLDELSLSLINYGIPDFTGLNLGDSEKQEEFCRIVQRVIQDYEPRFKRVTVKLVKNQEPLDRTLRFRIDALLHAEPVPHRQYKRGDPAGTGTGAGAGRLRFRAGTTDG